MIQNDEYVLTVLRYIEANPLRAKIVERADDYPWSSYRAHGLGEPHELLDPLVNYEELSSQPRTRQRKWAEKVHTPMEAAKLAAIRRSNATGIPLGVAPWVKHLARRLDLDLIIRPRGRPENSPPRPVNSSDPVFQPPVAVFDS